MPAERKRPMSYPLRLSSLFSALALISLALFARAGEIGEGSGGNPTGTTSPVIHIASSGQ